jgi:hypothetical protein
MSIQITDPAMNIVEVVTSHSIMYTQRSAPSFSLFATASAAGIL